MNYIKIYFLIFNFFFFKINLDAQNQLGAKAHFGYSRPLGIDFSYEFSSYEVEGVASQGFYFVYNRTLKKNQLEARLGVTKLGYVTRQYQGKTPNANFPNIPQDVHILEKSTFNLIYLDNAIGYVYTINDKMTIKGSLHYLLNISSILRNDYLFTEDDLLSHAIAKETRRINLKDSKQKFYNHPAISLELGHKLGKNLSGGLSYFIGLTESNPLMTDYIRYSRLNQNFSIFIAYTFRHF